MIFLIGLSQNRKMLEDQQFPQYPSGDMIRNIVFT